MVFHMKTTLNIDPGIMARLKQEAARQGKTMSELVESALRRLFSARARPAELPPLRTFRGGAELVDVADRRALHDAMDDNA
jgi:Ribbon-helix-helix protein, copG family